MANISILSKLSKLSYASNIYYNKYCKPFMKNTCGAIFIILQAIFIFALFISTMFLFVFGCAILIGFIVTKINPEWLIIGVGSHQSDDRKYYVDLITIGVCYFFIQLVSIPTHLIAIIYCTFYKKYISVFGMIVIGVPMICIFIDPITYSKYVELLLKQIMQINTDNIIRYVMLFNLCIIASVPIILGIINIICGQINIIYQLYDDQSKLIIDKKNITDV